MAATPQELFTATACVQCAGPIGPGQQMRIGLLFQIYNGIGGDMSTQEILDESGCFLCIPGVTIADAIEIGLLNAIATLLGGSSSSLTQVYSGTVPPASAPNDPTKAALYYDTSSGILYQWNIAGAAWV
jgi:hypothetical protein